MNIGLLDLILFILFVQLLTLVPFLLFQKSPKAISNRLLGFFLLSKAICISNFISFRLFDYTYEYFPHSFLFGTSFTIVWGPLLYLYVRSLTEKNFRIEINKLLHLIPFFIHFMILFFSYHIHSAETKREIITSGGIATEITGYYYYAFLNAYILVYTLASLFRIRSYQNALKNLYSSIDKNNLSWLNFIILGFLLKWSFDVVSFFSHQIATLDMILVYSSRITLFLFINIILYKALRNPTILLGDMYEVKGKRSSLSALSKSTYLEKLQNYMEKEKPFLNPNLTLEELSKMVAIPPRSLTTVLNETLNQNFYDYVNSFRIQESARILIAKEPSQKTILEVLFEVGFNNKASFNNAFKKHKGMTPSEYRKLQIS